MKLTTHDPLEELVYTSPSKGSRVMPLYPNNLIHKEKVCVSNKNIHNKCLHNRLAVVNCIR